MNRRDIIIVVALLAWRGIKVTAIWNGEKWEDYEPA